MDRLQVIDQEARRFAEVLADTPAEAPVPTCPEWTAGDLLWHVTEVHLFWAGILGADARTDADVAAIDRGKPDRPQTVRAALALRERATAELLDQLSRLDDADPRWSWWPADQTVGFTRRMQTYEATVHRVDAELAAGVEVSPIADDVAAGCVDQCVDVMWGWAPPWAEYRPRALVEFISANTEDTWLVEIGRWTGTSPESGKDFDEPRALRATGGTPTARVHGSVIDLARWSWGRGGTVELSGDPDAVAAICVLHDAGIS